MTTAINNSPGQPCCKGGCDKGAPQVTCAGFGFPATMLLPITGVESTGEQDLCETLNDNHILRPFFRTGCTWVKTVQPAQGSGGFPYHILLTWVPTEFPARKGFWFLEVTRLAGSWQSENTTPDAFPVTLTGGIGLCGGPNGGPNTVTISAISFFEDFDTDIIFTQGGLPISLSGGGNWIIAHKAPLSPADQAVWDIGNSQLRASRTGSTNIQDPISSCVRCFNASSATKIVFRTEISQPDVASSGFHLQASGLGILEAISGGIGVNFAYIRANWSWDGTPEDGFYTIETTSQTTGGNRIKPNPPVAVSDGDKLKIIIEHGEHSKYYVNDVLIAESNAPMNPDQFGDNTSYGGHVSISDTLNAFNGTAGLWENISLSITDPGE